MDLSGKVVAVTGSDGALGGAVAATLSAYGAKLALLTRSAGTAGSQPSGAVHYGGVDLTQETAVRSAMQRIAQDADVGRFVKWLEASAGRNWLMARELGQCTDSIKNRGGFLSGRCLICSSPQRTHRHRRALGAVKAATGMGAYAALKAGVAIDRSSGR